MYLHDITECVCLRENRIYEIYFEWHQHGTITETLLWLL